MTTEPLWAVIVMGVSGTGKTTVGRLLAQKLCFAFLDGDDLHPPENQRKMASGVALDDSDRAGWLDRIRRVLDRYLETEIPVVIACSALKRSYRQRLRDGEPRVKLVYLKGTYELIAKRLEAREHPFMPPELLRSQFDTLEEPEDAVVVDISPAPEDVVWTIVEQLGCS